MTLTTVTLTGTYAIGSTACTGTVTFTPQVPIVDLAGNVIRPVTDTICTLGSRGTLSVSLPVSDDPDLSATGWAWWVAEDIVGAPYRRYAIVLTTSMAPTADLADLVPLEVVPGWTVQLLQGDPNVLTIGTVTTVAPGGAATASIAGDSPEQVLSLGIPTGATGATGPANVLSVGTVTTVAPGGAATAAISGTTPAQTLDLGIPTGATGAACSLTMGTVTTGAAGSSAAATITGAAPNQTIALTIPRGDTGEVSAAQLALKAPLASPALTNVPTAPTAAPGTNTTQLATTAFARAADVAYAIPLVTAETLSAPLGAELGTGSGLTQTVTTAIGTTYQVGGAGFAAITLDGAALSVSAGFSSFVATAISHVLAGTGGTDLSVKAITGTSSALATMGGGLEFRRQGTNSAMGMYALRYNTTGVNNSAMGYTALSSNATGSNNSAMGYAALRSNTTGVSNSAMGMYALYSNTTGSYNSAMGVNGLRSNTTGSSNSAMGYAALYSPKGIAGNATTVASYQTAAGSESGQYAALTGNKGTAVGYRALFHTGASAFGSDAEAQGVDSIAIGRGAIALTDNSIQIGEVGTTYVLRFGNAGRVMGLVELKSIAAAAADFAAFKAAIAALT